MSTAEAKVEANAPIFIRIKDEPIQATTWFDRRELNGKKLRWPAILGTVIGFPVSWCLYHDRFFWPELTILILAIICIWTAYYLRLQSRFYTASMRTLCVAVGLSLATFVVWPSNQKRFASAHMGSLLKQFEEPSRRYLISQNPDGFWVPLSSWIVMPKPLWDFVGGEDFFPGSFQSTIPGDFITLRNLNRWDLSGMQLFLRRVNQGQTPPTAEAIQQLLSNSTTVIGANVNDWNRESISALMSVANPASPWGLHINLEGSVEKEPLSALLASGTRFNLILKDIHTVEAGCADLISSTANTPRRIDVFGDCKLTPEMLRLLAVAGPLQSLHITQSPDLPTFREACKTLVVSEMSWKIPISREYCEAMCNIQVPFRISGCMNDDAIGGLVGSQVSSLFVDEPSRITDSDVDALLQMPALRMLVVQSSSLSVSAILRLAQMSSLVQLTIVSDAIGQEEALSIQRQVLTIAKLSVTSK